ncbi:MAG: stage III sporulation protein AA [Lachnospiraceae bacterium]
MREADSLLVLFPCDMRESIQKLLRWYDRLEEIRLRVDKPMIVKLHEGEYFLTGEGRLTDSEGEAIYIREAVLREMLNIICKDSLYAFSDEIRQGFISVPGGHRVGICGQAVMEADGTLRTLKHFGSINIRVSHEIKGVADRILPYVYREGRPCSCLMISPPGCGKTTLLRDLVRQISNGCAYGAGICVGVVDERSEIAGCYLGIAQNDVGIRTDILDACPKTYGMMMLIRSMAPGMIAIDELGSEEDVDTVRKVFACGCGILATIHGEDMHSLQEKVYLRGILQDRIFDRYILLGKRNGHPGIRAVYGRDGELCCEWQEPC